jgi:hypothetical protein
MAATHKMPITAQMMPTVLPFPFLFFTGFMTGA